MVLASRSAARCEQAALHLTAQTGRPALGHACDVTDEDAVAALADRVLSVFGRLDVMVTSASVARGTIDELSAADLRASRRRLGPEDTAAGLLWLAMNFPAVCDAMLDKTEFDAVDDEDPARNPSRFPLDQHCERARRDPAEITRTVVEFDARDLGAGLISAGPGGGRGRRYHRCLPG